MNYLKGDLFVKSFVERTKCNFEQVENLDSTYETYKVTQLVNSLLGLLVVPESYGYTKCTDSIISKKLLNDIQSKVTSTYLTKNGNNESKSLKNIVRHMRNAIAHSKNLKFLPDETNKNQIGYIVFKDVDVNNSSFKFNLQLSIEQLKEFVYEFSDGIVRTLKGSVK